MTTMKDFEKAHPLRGEAKREFDRLRREMGVGYLILKARASADLTQAQLAKKIGSSQPMVARWESGAQVPSVRTLSKIAQATGFDLAVALHVPGAAEGEFAALSILPGRKASKRAS